MNKLAALRSLARSAGRRLSLSLRLLLLRTWAGSRGRKWACAQRVRPGQVGQPAGRPAALSLARSLARELGNKSSGRARCKCCERRAASRVNGSQVETMMDWVWAGARSPDQNQARVESARLSGGRNWPSCRRHSAAAAGQAALTERAAALTQTTCASRMEPDKRALRSTVSLHCSALIDLH